MKTIFKKIVALFLVALASVGGIFGTVSTSVYAEENDVTYGVTVSPMKEKIILNPGDTYAGSFTVASPSTSKENFAYTIGVSPFYATEDYDITYTENGDYNQITNWVELTDTSGVLAPNDAKQIYFKIKVPTNAPAGGQYAAIIVKVENDKKEGDDKKGTGMQINQSVGIAHTIFAEITGATIRNGEIISTTLPGFMFGGKITGTATLKNTGNVHADATYKMQVFPLFSGEEVFTNEEEPETSIILPDRTLHHETVWNETPAIGIFNVIYTVEFQGMTEQISRLVIICPLWLVFVIVFVIVAIIIWLVIRAKMRKKAATEEN